jgi:hypothetical protein
VKQGSGGGGAGGLSPPRSLPSRWALRDCTKHGGHVITPGVFTVPLDFGLLAFNGEARFLEIAVDDNTLSPRQVVTTAPYALFALDGGTIYTGGTGISVFGSTITANFGTTAGTIAQGNGVILNQSSPRQAGATFNISGLARVGDLRVDSPISGDTTTPALRVRSSLTNANPFSDRLRVDTSGGVVALGEILIGQIPASASGYRMMWYPGKVAFRAGGVNGNMWDDVNIGFYSTATGSDTVASGNFSVAMGNSSEATQNAAVALGDNNVVSGISGFSVGRNNTCSATGCMAMGTSLTAAANFSTAMGVRVGSGAFTGSFIWGDNSATTVANTASNQFMARAAGGYRFRTSADLSTGCDLPGGSGVFQCTSDRNAKQDFRSLDAEEILLRVTALPVDSWRYKSEEGHVRHIGPTAQDFRAAFGLGTGDRSIGMLDIDGVNMLAIQALASRTDELARKDREIDALRTQVDALQSAVERIEGRLSTAPFAGSAHARTSR